MNYWEGMPAYIETIEHSTVAMRNDAAYEKCRPSFIYKPKLTIDGNKWCALYGDNLQDGVAGFGSSPAEAYKAFDAEWIKDLKEKPQ
jgi:hypothetical protein